MLLPASLPMAAAAEQLRCMLCTSWPDFWLWNCFLRWFKGLWALVGRQWLCSHHSWVVDPLLAQRAAPCRAVPGMLGAGSMGLLRLCRGCGKHPGSYHTHCLMRPKLPQWTWSISSLLERGWVGSSCIQGCRCCHRGGGHWWCCDPSELSRASDPAECVPPPSRITSSEKYQTSVAKKRVLTYFGHLFIFKLLLSVSVKKLLWLQYFKKVFPLP